MRLDGLTNTDTFQKQLRLQEARQLMLNQNIDASRAAFLVGYESASQFSREYRRHFGAPPQQDVPQPTFLCVIIDDQTIRSKGQRLRLYVSFPLALASV